MLVAKKLQGTWPSTSRAYTEDATKGSSAEGRLFFFSHDCLSSFA
jgi:hypothetical protein